MAQNSGASSESGGPRISATGSFEALVTGSLPVGYGRRAARVGTLVDERPATATGPLPATGPLTVPATGPLTVPLTTGATGPVAGPSTGPVTAALPTRRSLREARAGQPVGEPAGQSAGQSAGQPAGRPHARPDGPSSGPLTAELELVRPRRSESPSRRLPAWLGRGAALKVGALVAVATLGLVYVVQSRQGTVEAQTFLTTQPTASPSLSAESGLPGATTGPSSTAFGALATPTAAPSVSGPSGIASPGASGSAAASATASAGSKPATTKAAGPSKVTAGSPRQNHAGGTMALQMYGSPQSGLSWHSGFWLGGTKNTSRMVEAGSWRGRPMDFATGYQSYGSWSDFSDESAAIGVYTGFKGRLALGVPLLPSNRAGQYDDVLSGAHDDDFRAIARNLKKYGFGDSAIRVGPEANGNWNPWGVTADNAPQYKAAFRRVVGIMRAEAPQLSFWFDLAASANPLPGTSTRTGVFDVMYPGDDVVDGIAMDHYDFYSLVAKNDAQFAQAMRPSNGFGLADAADFARKHGKGFAVPEWGVHTTQGAGDNPYFIKAMWGFFNANKDVLVFEDYFDEGDTYIGAAIWDPAQNPQSGAMYQSLWG